MKALARSLLAVTAGLIGCLLAGCVTSSDLSSMTPAGVLASRKTGSPVQATVVGGAALTAVQGPGITNEDFKSVLETSLVQSGLFKSAGPGGYQLEAFIGNIDQPVMGFAMRVNMDVSYVLRRGGSVVWRKNIHSTYEAATGEAFAGAVRLRKATEGAARENVSALVRALDAARF